MSLILYLLFCLIVWMVDLGKRERVRHCQWSKGNYGCRNYIGWIFLGGTKRQGKECMKEVKEIMGVGIRMGGQRGGVTCNQWGLMMRRLWCEGDWIGSNIILTVCQKWRFGGRLKGELGIEGARKRIWRYANCASTDIGEWSEIIWIAKVFNTPRQLSKMRQIREYLLCVSMGDWHSDGHGYQMREAK